MNGLVFARHWRHKIVRGRARPAALPIHDRRGTQMRLGEFFLLILLHYKWVFLAIWIATVIYWFVSQVLPIDQQIIEPEPNEP